ncbi:MAG: DNA repair protein RecN [Lachnospiraceae bacterium]|nr:DNA repair protein RecN [Lachnospiraceae bacterium]
MLESLHVKNLALIKESEVFFYPGLNILSGETGAGKSIILGSVRLALGAKAGREFIRNGEDYALIELIFKSSRKELIDALNELELPVEDDGTVFIQRKIMEGRSTARINGETVTGRGLKRIASLLIDIHGQHDTAELLDSKNYLDILDDYSGFEAEQILEEVAGAYADYISVKKEFDDNRSLDKNREKELSLAEFEIEEIDAAGLRPGEDEESEDRYRLMNNSKKIVESVSRAYSLMNGEGGTQDGLDHALREIRSVLRYDDSLAEMEADIAAAADILGQCSRNMDDYMSKMEFSQDEFNAVENRLDVLNHLKNKYAGSIEAILDYADERRAFVEKLSDLSAYMERLEKKLNRTKEELLNACDKLSKVRIEKARILSEEIVRNLKQLNLENVRCEISVVSDRENITEKGYDNVDFLVSFNVGEPLRSLATVASGGELSRFMLALKAITADKEKTETLIFDEIDSGISGKTAWNVAEKMNVIGKDHQVIAITHLPQIAAMADSHYLINKSNDDDRTQTTIKKLSEEESTQEVARLMSTDVITDILLQSAKELRSQARVSKKL